MDNPMEDTEEQNDFDTLREAIQALFAPPDLVACIRSQDEEIKRLRRFVADQSKTCYSCEVCGHARTTRECLRCDIKKLRDIAEREAKLREVIETAIEDLIDGDAFVIDRLRAALEQKGGE